MNLNISEYRYGYGVRVRVTGTGTEKFSHQVRVRERVRVFSDFLMTEYGLISIFKVRIMYGLKTAKILVRVRDGVRVIFEIGVRRTRTPE